MEFTLLDNGADSLKKAKHSIEAFESLSERSTPHHLKDAIIYLNHSIEILLKYILSEKSEYLIFKDLKKFTLATKELLEYQEGSDKVPITNGFGYRRKYYRSVFDVPKGRRLITIGLNEAIERVKYLCGIDIPIDFEQGISLIQSYRNQITHNSISVDSTEKKELILSLKILHVNTFKFFDSNIISFNEAFNEQRFEITEEEWTEHQKDMEDYYYDRAMGDLSIEDLQS